MIRTMICVLIAGIMMAGCTAQPGQTPPSGVPEEPVQPAAEEKAPYVKITAEEAKKIMDEQPAVVVDVRTQEEYEEGHIKDAVLIPVDTIEKEAGKVLTDKSAVILVYCRSGNRSKTASEALINLGYLNVYDFGGIIDWPYEVVK